MNTEMKNLTCQLSDAEVVKKSEKISRLGRDGVL